MFEQEMARKYSPSTVKAMRRAVREFLQFCDKPVEKIDEFVIADWSSEFALKYQDYHRRTVYTKNKGVYLFLNFCFNIGLIDRHPMSDYLLLCSRLIYEFEHKNPDDNNVVNLYDYSKKKLRS